MSLRRIQLAQTSASLRTKLSMRPTNSVTLGRMKCVSGLKAANVSVVPSMMRNSSRGGMPAASAEENTAPALNPTKVSKSLTENGRETRPWLRDTRKSLSARMPPSL